MLPFYKTVEFTEGMDPKASARLEAQLQKAGILDALVIADEDLKKYAGIFRNFWTRFFMLRKKGPLFLAG